MNDTSTYNGKYYKSKVVREVCKISARQLDYWIDRDVIKPSGSFGRNEEAKRNTRLFTFKDIVQIRIVKSLRDEGVSVDEIRKALLLLREKYGKRWHKPWLVVFDKEVCFFKSEKQLESLSKKARGQLMFPVIAMGQAKNEVATSLATAQVFDENQYSSGRVCSM